MGYVPYNVGINENAARTLEYAYDDWCIYQLIDVIAQIERWYGVEIRLHHKQIAQDLLSGSFRNESIQNVIRSLSIQYGFKYEIHKDIITIY